MNKRNSTQAPRRLLAVLAGVGVVLGLSFAAFLGSISDSDKTLAADSDKTLAADSSRQTIEIKTTQKSPDTPRVEATPDPATPLVTAAPETTVTAKPKQTVVNSSTRVKVTPKPVATPIQEADQTSSNPVVTPTQISPTEGYIRPQLSVIGVTSCVASGDGWIMTLSWKLTGGNYNARWFTDRSGDKTPGDSWIISLREELIGAAPTGSHSFWTEGDYILFMAMNGDNNVIDELWLPDRTTADTTGLCR